MSLQKGSTKEKSQTKLIIGVTVGLVMIFVFIYLLASGLLSFTFRLGGA
ncbi:hypothetical protein LCGC14_2087970 [marine sediment metagenome]|uniref:Uncharacterized protein n=1 Tax=marine sediment metagenome TaxID=412755 RepID=A0A0F9HAL1_9ZZZZ